MPSVIEGTVSLFTRDPAVWSDPTAAFNVVDFGTVTIWCTTAPTTPYTIETGPAADKTSASTAVANSSAGISTTTTISATGQYSVPGGGFIKLTGGTGGAFYLSAGA